MAELNENWSLIFTTQERLEAEIIRGMLENNQIPVILNNRQDSSYVFLGDIELFVPLHFRELAVGLIEGTIKN